MIVILMNIQILFHNHSKKTRFCFQKCNILHFCCIFAISNPTQLFCTKPCVSQNTIPLNKHTQYLPLIYMMLHYIALWFIVAHPDDRYHLKNSTT